MEVIGLVLASLLAVVVSSFIARATRLPTPLVQMALGALIFQSRLTSAVLDPQVFFLLFLPPLLFLDGWRIPKDALRQDADAILRLALGLVLFTVLGMGLFIHSLIPAIPLGVALALAAVLSPTDPVAVFSIASQAPLPKRLMQILQGEALLNDATGLVCMRFAVAAVLADSFSLPQAVGSFLWLALGGVGIGVALTALIAWLSARTIARFGHDADEQILVTLLMPFGVYLLADRLGCSGILAAAAAGITMSFMNVWPWQASTRLRRTAVWDTLQMAINGSVFVLLGEQLPALIAAAPRIVGRPAPQAALQLAGWTVAIVLALVALRFAWVWVALKLVRLHASAGSPAGADAPGGSGWRMVLVMALAGVRGAVTLAGVFTLPLALALADGSAFPARDLSILLAAGVIVLSLVLAAVALPIALRGHPLPVEASAQPAREAALYAAAQAAVRAVEAERASLAAGPADARRFDHAVRRVLEPYRQRIARHEHGAALRDGAGVDGLERRLRLVALRAERDEIRAHAGEHGLDDTLLRSMVSELDHQEARYGG
jgi:CPA1 family monovalent cation:H+ antiporter